MVFVCLFFFVVFIWVLFCVWVFTFLSSGGEGDAQGPRGHGPKGAFWCVRLELLSHCSDVLPGPFGVPPAPAPAVFHILSVP